MTLSMCSYLLASTVLLGQKPATVQEFPKITKDGERSITVDPKLDIVVPQVLAGGGWTTSLIFTNLGGQPADFKTYFVDYQGNQLFVPVSQLGGKNSSGVRVTLSAFGSGSVDLGSDKMDQLGSGWVLIFPSDSSRQLTVSGMAVLHHKSDAGMDIDITLPFSRVTETRIIVPFNTRNGDKTILTVVNPEAAPSAPDAVYQFTFRDEDGVVLTTQSGQLPAFNQATFSIGDFWPDLQERTGTVQVTTTGRWTATFALRVKASGSLATMLPLAIDSTVDSPVRPSTPPTTLPGVSSSCSALEGAVVFADDAKYLGKITANQFDSDSIGNPYGLYGSAYSTTSIFNQFGIYGSQFSSLSAFNPSAARPPIIFVGRTPEAFLTTNGSKTPRIDPSVVALCVGRR